MERKVKLRDVMFNDMIDQLTILSCHLTIMMQKKVRCSLLGMGSGEEANY